MNESCGQFLLGIPAFRVLFSNIKIILENLVYIESVTDTTTVKALYNEVWSFLMTQQAKIFQNEPSFAAALIEINDSVLFIKENDVFKLPYCSCDDIENYTYSLKNYIKRKLSVSCDINEQLVTQVQMKENQNSSLINCYRVRILLSDLKQSNTYEWINKNDIKKHQLDPVSTKIFDAITEVESNTQKLNFSLWLLLTIAFPLSPIIFRLFIILLVKDDFSLPDVLQVSDFLYLNLCILFWLLTSNLRIWREENYIHFMLFMVILLFLIIDVMLIALTSISATTDEALPLSIVFTVILVIITVIFKKQNPDL